MNGCGAYMKSLETAVFRVSWNASLASSEISDKLLAIMAVARAPVDSLALILA
jgi:hypothetical protein